jgi:hypothetical protein
LGAILVALLDTTRSSVLILRTSRGTRVETLIVVYLHILDGTTGGLTLFWREGVVSIGVSDRAIEYTLQ